ncbi:MAG: cysteine desulfurase family protein [Stackebrandtia sp.]
MTYLDHAATTPMLPQARDAYLEAATLIGNPSSMHASGRAARRRVEEARELIAARLGAAPSEVVFTGGGTESDNLALKGLYWARHGAEPARNRILAAETEHHAVVDVVTWLSEHEGAEVIWLPVDGSGRVEAATVDALVAELGDTVALASVMWANNEVGTVQPITEIAAACARGAVPCHSDAVQAVGQLPVSFDESGLSAMSVTGHKLGGPAGVGALLLRRDVDCTPLLHGGGQERDVRSGTVDLPGIVSFAAAVDVAITAREETAKRLTDLRDDLIDRVHRAVPDAVLNGDPSRRLPGNAHFSFPGCEGDALLMLLDAANVECATGSACSAGVAQPSHVLLAMGHDEALARSSLRFSLGHTSTAADVDALIVALPGAVERARMAGLS